MPDLNEHRAAQLVSALLIGGYVPDYLRARAEQVAEKFDADMRDVQIQRMRVMVRAQTRLGIERMQSRDADKAGVIAMAAAEAATELGMDACAPCAKHYGDHGLCDQGKPLASPHRIGVDNL